MMKLKNYQETALSVLAEFLDKCAESGNVAEVYAKLCENNDWVKNGKALYHDRFNGAPAVCVRVPTGGGKTVIAAASIKTVDDVYLQTGGAPVVLWLTPSDVITQQTLKALSTSGHPYRELLEANFSPVRAIDIDELPNLSRSDLENGCTIIVANVQTFNITDTDKRKVYSFREDLSTHFTGLTAQEAEGLERVSAEDTQVSEDGSYLKRHNVGEIKHSVANLLRLHHPYIVVDEAHNNRTDRFFDTLNRLGPRVLLELTATPTTKNNVIYQVSAWELKADEMIKLPVLLNEHTQTGWQACLDKTVAMRQELERKASDETQYLRPIVLIQAQKKGSEPSPEKVRDYLIESHHIPEAQIAIATGTQKDLEDVNLFSPDCPIRFVITIQALKEGWDCSFAYVLCGLQNIQSSKDIEQLLGRVLRMPYAKRRSNEALNCAYANIMSENTQVLAQTLRDRLVATMGFDKMESTALVEIENGKESRQQLLPDDVQLDFFGPKKQQQGIKIVIPVSKSPEEVQKGIKENDLEEVIEVLDAQPKKGVLISVKPGITQETEQRILDTLGRNESIKAKEGIKNSLRDFHIAISQKAAMDNQKTPFPRIPCLCFLDPDDGECRVLDQSSGIDSLWNPSKYATRLVDFKPRQVVFISKLDVNAHAKLQVETLEKDVFEIKDEDSFLTTTVQDLVLWLEKEVHRPDVTSAVMTAFVGKIVHEYLIGEVKFSLSQMLQLRVQIANAIKRLLANNYEQACKENFQRQLDLACPTPDEDIYCFHYDSSRYTPRNVYDPQEGGRDFKKHFYSSIHDLRAKTEGGKEREEFLCAVAIEDNLHVKRWIRNIESSPYSFRLAKSSGYFYPDFVAELDDGRILVVEYKGEALVTNDDSKEKAEIGAIWEKNSNGRGLFLMARKEINGQSVANQIEDKISI